MRHSHSPDPWAMEECSGGTTIHGEPWDYTELGPHQELTDAEEASGLQGFTGLWGKQRSASRSPRAQSSVWPPGVELAWEGTKVPRQGAGHPHLV